MCPICPQCKRGWGMSGFTMEIKTERGQQAPEVSRLKRMLKHLGRAFGFRVVRIRAGTDGTDNEHGAGIDVRCWHARGYRWGGGVKVLRTPRKPQQEITHTITDRKA